MESPIAVRTAGVSRNGPPEAVRISLTASCPRPCPKALVSAVVLAVDRNQRCVVTFEPRPSPACRSPPEPLCSPTRPSFAGKPLHRSLPGRPRRRSRTGRNRRQSSTRLQLGLPVRTGSPATLTRGMPMSQALVVRSFAPRLLQQLRLGRNSGFVRRAELYSFPQPAHAHGNAPDSASRHRASKCRWIPSIRVR